jgi:alcohol dehydrogenase YqhD (iron-dependent ADH family)
MNPFNYSYPVKIYFGDGITEQTLETEFANKGKNTLLAYGGGSVKKTGLYDKIHKILLNSGKNISDFGGIMPNPTYAKVQEGARLVRENNIDFILAVGGGSVSDCCKVVSAQAKIEEDLWDYEYTLKKQPEEFIPMGVVVTVSGTGSEQNNGAVITHEEKQVKCPLWGAFADWAILDVELTMTVPFKQVVSGAFDTLSHCMETYFGKPGDNNVTDEINESVQRNTIRNIRALLENPEDRTARSELMWDSAMAENGILKLGKQTDFQCHMIEHQLAAYTDCNHGAGLAVIHPAVYRRIYEDYAPKFARWSSEVWGIAVDGKTDETVALEGVEALAAFIREIGLPCTFTEMGITDKDVFRKTADSCILTPGCARKLDRNEIYQMLAECE